MLAGCHLGGHLSLPWERPWWPNLVVSWESMCIQKFLEVACPLPCGQLWVHAPCCSSGPPDHSEARLPRPAVVVAFAWSIAVASQGSAEWEFPVTSGCCTCGIQEGQEIKALHYLWEPCLHFNLNLQRHAALAGRCLCEMGLPVPGCLPRGPLASPNQHGWWCSVRAGDVQRARQLTPRLAHLQLLLEERPTDTQLCPFCSCEKLAWNHFASHGRRCMRRQPRASSLAGVLCSPHTALHRQCWAVGGAGALTVPVTPGTRVRLRQGALRHTVGWEAAQPLVSISIVNR